MKKISSDFTFFIVVLLKATVLMPGTTGTKSCNFCRCPRYVNVRVGDSYYMSSTTMHMAPGVPIMKSKDLVNWKIVNYAYDILDMLMP